MSAITAITGVQHATASTGIGTGHGGSSFGSALKSAIDQVDGYQQDANEAINQFLQGNGELHNVALATQRAEMAFDLGVQIRNKVISAYQEVMKMQL